MGSSVQHLPRLSPTTFTSTHLLYGLQTFLFAHLIRERGDESHAPHDPVGAGFVGGNPEEHHKVRRVAGSGQHASAVHRSVHRGAGTYAIFGFTLNFSVTPINFIVKWDTKLPSGYCTEF